MGLIQGFSVWHFRVGGLGLQASEASAEPFLVWKGLGFLGLGFRVLELFGGQGDLCFGV